VSSPADETRSAVERRLKIMNDDEEYVDRQPALGCRPSLHASAMMTTEDITVSDAYLAEAQQLAGEVETQSSPGDKHWDLAQYAATLVREVYRQRSRVAYLEGWKEATEAGLDRDRRA
jgi:hypothetical protein